MNTLADTMLASGDALMYSVFIWNGEHTGRKLYKNYADEADGRIAVAALRVHGLEAELIVVGRT